MQAVFLVETLASFAVSQVMEKKRSDEGGEVVSSPEFKKDGSGAAMQGAATAAGHRKVGCMLILERESQ